MPKIILDNQTGAELAFRICIKTNDAGDIIIAVEGLSSGNSGKLTGQQLKAVHCLEQLQALLDDQLYPLVKQMAEASDTELQSMLDFASSDMTEFEDLSCSSPASEWRKAISAMSVFCHSEIVERGLRSTI